MDVEFAEKKDTSLGNVPAREKRNVSDANKLVIVSPTALNLVYLLVLLQTAMWLPCHPAITQSGNHTIRRILQYE